MLSVEINARTLPLQSDKTVVRELLASCMDGSHYVLYWQQSEEEGAAAAEPGSLCLSVGQKFTDHRKYVVQARWADDGDIFATAAHDQTAILYRRGKAARQFFTRHFFNWYHIS